MARVPAQAQDRQHQESAPSRPILGDRGLTREDEQARGGLVPARAGAVSGTAVTVNPAAVRSRRSAGSGQVQVVHDERGTPDGVAGPHGQVEPAQRPVPGRGDGRPRADREGEDPAGPQRAVHAREQRGPLGGQEVPERPEADREVEGLGEGQRPGVGPDPAGVRVGHARPREHARAEVDAGGPPGAQRLENAQARRRCRSTVESASRTGRTGAAPPPSRRAPRRRCGRACGRTSGRAGRSRPRPRTAPAPLAHAETALAARTWPQRTRVRTVTG